MRKKIAVYFLLLSFLGQSMLANALPVFTTFKDISVFTNLSTSIPTSVPINESPCHEETASSIFVNGTELSSIRYVSKNLTTIVNKDSENPIKHQHCEKTCHCSISVHSGLFSAVLFKGIETYGFPGHPQFVANYPSSFPIKIPASLLRPPSLLS